MIPPYSNVTTAHATMFHPPLQLLSITHPTHQGCDASHPEEETCIFLKWLQFHTSQGLIRFTLACPATSNSTEDQMEYFHHIRAWQQRYGLASCNATLLRQMLFQLKLTYNFPPPSVLRWSNLLGVWGETSWTWVGVHGQSPQNNTLKLHNTQAASASW